MFQRNPGVQHAALASVLGGGGGGGGGPACSQTNVQQRSEALGLYKHHQLGSADANGTLPLLDDTLHLAGSTVPHYVMQIGPVIPC